MKGVVSLAASSTRKELNAPVFNTCKEAVGAVVPIPTFPLLY